MPTRSQGEWIRSRLKPRVNDRSYKRICLWCGITFPTSRPDAKTHGPRCRVALARYVKKHGRPPLFPFGLKPDKKR